MAKAAKGGAKTGVKSGVKGRLYVVATPIGNVGDISARAREVLAAADLVAAEDTRHSGRLLQRLGIEARLRAYHDFSGPRAAAGIQGLLKAGKQVALICDAGTPLVADPGFRLVQAARREGYEVTPVPGPSALLAALSVAGMPSDRFVFEGFLPAALAARRRRLAALRSEPRTLIFYESCHRILPCLADMQDAFGGGRGLFIGRELTKLFESHHLGSIADSIDWLNADPARQQGEFVLVLEGAEKAEGGDEALQRALQMAPILREELNDPPPRRLASLLARLTGVRSKAIYRALLDERR